MMFKPIEVPKTSVKPRQNAHTRTHAHTVTEQEQPFIVEVGRQEEQGFTALTKIKHEDSVVHSTVGKTNIIFL